MIVIGYFLVGGVIIGYCIAQYDYAANQSQMLSLRAGDHIAILNKGSGGWWKGDLGGRVCRNFAIDWLSSKFYKHHARYVIANVL